MLSKAADGTRHDFRAYKSTIASSSETLSSESSQVDVIEEAALAEASFRKRYPLAWVSSILGPPVITAVILVFVGLTYGWSVAGQFAAAGVVTFTIFGRFVILFGSDAAVTESVEGSEFVNMLSSGQLFVMVTYMDVMTALFVACNVGVLFRLPLVGKRLSGLVADARFILKAQPWMKRATFLGLVVFVIFPTSTTGSVGGSILGRLLGLKRKTTLLAIFTGSVLGNGLMYFFSEQLRPLKRTVQDSTAAKVIGVLVVVVLVLAIERLFNSLKKKYMAEASVPATTRVANSDSTDSNDAVVG